MPSAGFALAGKTSVKRFDKKITDRLDLRGVAETR